MRSNLDTKRKFWKRNKSIDKSSSIDSMYTLVENSITFWIKRSNWNTRCGAALCLGTIFPTAIGTSTWKQLNGRNTSMRNCRNISTPKREISTAAVSSSRSKTPSKCGPSPVQCFTQRQWSQRSATETSRRRRSQGKSRRWWRFEFDFYRRFVRSSRRFLSSDLRDAWDSVDVHVFNLYRWFISRCIHLWLLEDCEFLLSKNLSKQISTLFKRTREFRSDWCNSSFVSFSSFILLSF